MDDGAKVKRLAGLGSWQLFPGRVLDEAASADVKSSEPWTVSSYTESRVSLACFEKGDGRAPVLGDLARKNRLSVHGQLASPSRDALSKMVPIVPPSLPGSVAVGVVADAFPPQCMALLAPASGRAPRKGGCRGAPRGDAPTEDEPFSTLTVSAAAAGATCCFRCHCCSFASALLCLRSWMVFDRASTWRNKKACAT